MRAILVSMAISSVLLGACATQKTPTTFDPALQKVWKVEQFPSLSAQAVAQAKGRMNFKDLPQATARLGCNSMGFEVVYAHQGKIRLQNVFSTLMYCEGAMAMEEGFRRLLEQIKHYRIENNHLILETDKGERIRLSAE